MTDIEIAQKNVMIPVTEIASKIGISEESLELYGKYKAKVSFAKLKDLQAKAADSSSRGKLILVTAMTPTAAGEGKSTVTIIYYLIRISEILIKCIYISINFYRTLIII